MICWYICFLSVFPPPVTLTSLHSTSIKPSILGVKWSNGLGYSLGSYFSLTFVDSFLSNSDHQWPKCFKHPNMQVWMRFIEIQVQAWISSSNGSVQRTQGAPVVARQSQHWQWRLPGAPSPEGTPEAVVPECLDQKHNNNWRKHEERLGKTMKDQGNRAKATLCKNHWNPLPLPRTFSSRHLLGKRSLMDLMVVQSDDTASTRPST